MNPDFLCRFLLWSLIINYAILLTWFLVFVFAPSWIFRLHGRWFHLSEAGFGAVHYSGMALYKIGILLFNLVPFLVLCLMRRGSY